MERRDLISLLAVVAAVIGVQLTLTGIGKEFYLTQMIMAVYYSVVVLGLCLLMGYAGQVSLGHGAFFAIGGYVSAVLTTHDFSALKSSAFVSALAPWGVFVSKPSLYDNTTLLTVSPWAAFVCAMLLTIAIALLVGYPALRLKGHYLAMATLGFGLIVYRLLLGSNFTGAADGISGVPPWQLAGDLSIAGRSALRVQNYYIAWTFALVVLVLLLNLVNSRVGRALRAVHEGELAANAMGINTARVKLQVFVISALLGAAAGCFLAHFNGGIGPSEASAFKSVRYVALVAAGGLANLWGALLISFLLNFLSLRGCFGTYDNAVFGIILIAIVSLAPDGPLKPLGRWLQRGFERLFSRRKVGHGAP